MPLVKGAKARTRKGFGENVKREMEAGRPQKQSVAIAYSEADRGMRKHHEKAEHHMKKAEEHHHKAKEHMEKAMKGKK